MCSTSPTYLTWVAFELEFGLFFFGPKHHSHECRISVAFRKPRGFQSPRDSVQISTFLRSPNLFVCDHSCARTWSFPFIPLSSPNPKGRDELPPFVRFCHHPVRLSWVGSSQEWISRRRPLYRLAAIWSTRSPFFVTKKLGWTTGIAAVIASKRHVVTGHLVEISRMKLEKDWGWCHKELIFWQKTWGSKKSLKHGQNAAKVPRQQHHAAGWQLCVSWWGVAQKISTCHSPSTVHVAHASWVFVCCCWSSGLRMLGCVACLFCGPCGLIVCCLQLDERQCWLAPNGRQGVYASNDGHPLTWYFTWKARHHSSCMRARTQELHDHNFSNL